MIDSTISFLNHQGQHAVVLAVRVWMEITLLLAGLILVDRVLRDRIRASLRYGLWMLLVVKLLLPPALMSPTSIAYWMGPLLSRPPVTQTTTPWLINQGDSTPEIPVAASRVEGVPRPALTGSAVFLALWMAGTTGLAFWMLQGQRQMARRVAAAWPAPASLQSLLQATVEEVGLKRIPELRLSEGRHSPAVCGLGRPVILLPRHLELSREAWRAVFLHELIHLRRYDLWANLIQVLAQILWWWNPLVWWANARIRHLRELAVDEAVMLATQPGSDAYPATLVAMARHCLAQPAMMLNFLGILESPTRLELRVRRLLEKPLPRKASLGWAGWLILGTVGCAAVPMGYRERDPQIATAVAVAPTLVSPLIAASPNPETATNSSALVTRTYRMDPRSMLTVLGSIPTAPIAPGEDVVQFQLRGFLATAGFDFPKVASGQAPDQSQPAAFFNRTNGDLHVRAFRVDQDRIEALLQRQTFVPAQIQMTAQVVEGDVKSLGELRLPGSSGAVFGGRTEGSLTALLTAAEGVALVEQFKAGRGIEILTTPKVTTLSGRSARLSVTEVRTIVTGQSNTPAGPVILTTDLPFGPTVDLMAWNDPVQTNALHLKASAQLVEFLGYQEARIPMPLIRTNAARGEARLWDGQTLVLQLPPVTNSVHMVDRVPVLSDIPLVGRLFKQKSTGKMVRQRWVLIRPELIDPTGHRINDPKRLPFDPATRP